MRKYAKTVVFFTKNLLSLCQNCQKLRICHEFLQRICKKYANVLYFIVSFLIVILLWYFLIKMLERLYFRHFNKHHYLIKYDIKNEPPTFGLNHYGTKGREFESLRVHQENRIWTVVRVRFFKWYNYIYIFHYAFVWKIYKNFLPSNTNCSYV